MTKRTKYLVTGTGPAAVLSAFMLDKKGVDDVLIVGPKPDLGSMDKGVIPFYVWLNSEIYDVFKWLELNEFVDKVEIETANVGVYWRGALEDNRNKEMMDAYNKKTGKDYMSGGRRYFKYIKGPYSEAFNGMFEHLKSSGNTTIMDDMVKSVDMESRYVETANGESIIYDCILNTIPLDFFINMSATMPLPIKELPAGNVYVLSVPMSEVEIDELSEIDWDKYVYIYFPEEGYPWYRLSRNRTPDGDYYCFEFINKIPENSPLLSNFISDKNVSLISKGVISTIKQEIIDAFAQYFNVHHISRYSRWCSGWKINDAAQYISDRKFE